MSRALAAAVRVLALVLALLVATPAPAFAGPRLDMLPTDDRIEMHYEPGLEATARELRATADYALERINADLVDLAVPRRIRIQLVRDSSSLPLVAPAGRGAPPWAIGVAYPDLGIISVAIRRGAQLSDPGQTLRHELAHVALGAALGRRAPHWLHEGFAYQHSADWSWDRMETLAGMSWFGGITPLDQLDNTFPAEELPAHRAYAQSYDFVGFLSRRGRYDDAADDGDRWPFRKFLASIAHGDTLDAAAIRAYGRPMNELFEEWRSDLSKRYLLAPVGLIGLAVWLLCAVLLAIAYWRKRRQNRRRLGEWEREEREQDEALARLRPVSPPPYVQWPGEDPFADVDEDKPGPKLLN